MFFIGNNKHLLVVCLLIYFQAGFSQDRKLADSLILIYNEENRTGVDKLELLRNLAFNTANEIEESLKYANELIALSQESNNDLYLYRGYSLRGQVYQRNGNLTLALQSFIQGSEAASKIENKSYEGGSYLSIADVYSKIGNPVNAENYYTKSIEILRKTKDSLTLVSALLNAGDEFFKNEKYNEALRYFEESGQLFQLLKYPIGTAYNLGNVGMVYAEQGKDDLAEQYMNQAIAMLEELEDYYPITVYLTYVSDIYSRKNDFSKALNYAQRSLDLAKQYKLKEQISNANLTLSELH